MTLKAGRLRHRIELQRQHRSQDSTTGEITVTWQTQAKVWAAIEPLSVREFISSQSKQSEVTARIVIRYRPDIDASWRIVHRDKIYNIQGVLGDIDSGLEYITLPVREGVNDGV